MASKKKRASTNATTGVAAKRSKKRVTTTTARRTTIPRSVVIREPNEMVDTSAERMQIESEIVDTPRPVASSTLREQPLHNQRPQHVNAEATMRDADLRDGENSINNCDNVSARELLRLLEKSLERRDTSSNVSNAHLLYRLSRAKSLPEFSGDALQWRRFKNAFESSSLTGEYTDFENIERLDAAIKGKARDVVGNLIATGHSAALIIKTLELHFGNKKAITAKIFKEIRMLPSLKNKEIRLLDFATKISTATATLQSLDIAMTAISDDLLDSVVNKLPETLQYMFIGYSTRLNSEKTEWEKLSLFLYEEAEKAVATGILNTDVTDEPIVKENKNKRVAQEKKTVYALGDSEKTTSSANPKNNLCAICSNNKHKTLDCETFKDATVNERWDLAKRYRLCFRCLGRGHNRFACKAHTCNRCKRHHHMSLHQEKRQIIKNKNEEEDTVANTEQIEVVTCTSRKDVSPGRSKSTVLLKIIPIRIKKDSKYIDTFALLDEGSTVTLVDAGITKKLNITGLKINIQLQSVNGVKILPLCEKLNLNVSGVDGSFELKGAITVENLDLHSQTIPEKLAERVEKLAIGSKIARYNNVKAKVLIGQDNWKLIVAREVIEIGINELAVSRCKLGWVLHGSVDKDYTMRVGTWHLKGTLMNKKDKDENLNNIIKEFFELENIGVNNEILKLKKSERAIEILEKTSKKLNRGWEVGLLWKTDSIADINSLNNAKNRLYSLERRIDRDPIFGNLYYAEMKRFLDKGYAKKVDENDKRKTTWFLPHFGVMNPNKPNKIRIVFDAAAKSSGRCLNDMLEVGPDLLQSLPGILIRFRRYAVAFKADICDMFLRIRIIEKDEVAQRFLWRGRDRSGSPEKYQMNSLIFGAKSSPTSAIYIKNKNANNFVERYPEAAKSIELNSYMDDYLMSAETTDEAIAIARNVIKINTEANFEMHGWASNVLNLFEKDEEKDDIGKALISNLGDKDKEKVLGLVWDRESDSLKFNVLLTKIADNIKNKTKIPSKRQVLQIIMSIYDPLGLITPFILRSKILMQEIWRSGVGWDDTIREEEKIGWCDWLDDLAHIKYCSIPRCLNINKKTDHEAQLHVFCDASSLAFAAVAYLRVIEPNDFVRVSLIMSKSKIAPLKTLTIPRLELQAALLGARLGNFVEKEIQIELKKRIFWSDSSIVLAWIKSDPRTKQNFVANRLTEIQERTKNTEWRWVPTTDNPADDATRIRNQAMTDNNSRWFKGPEFLIKQENLWPNILTLEENEKLKADAIESRKMKIFHITKKIEEISIYTRLLGWRGLIKLAKRVRKCFEIWCKKRQTTTIIKKIDRDEQFIIRKIQIESYASEISNLKNGKRIKLTSSILKLNAYLDNEQILRCDGRAKIMHNKENFNNNPIILDGKHSMTRELIREFHRRFHHGSDESVRNEIKQDFLITGLRKALKSIIAKCIVCKIQRGKPQAPMMGDLPAARLAIRERPFSHCGVDYFGPYSVKIGRRREKRWGVLFTCLTTRAIHIELASSLSASSAILALQRFSARRGVPLVIYSDNGTNFRGAESELKEALANLDRKKIRDYTACKKIEWRFNPPDAAHMGGVWERLIKSVKTTLRVILKEHTPSEEVLQTLMTEAEHTVNSRPLTHVSTDPRDQEALTPNHFLIGSSSGNVKIGNYKLETLCLKKQWRNAQALADAFWRRWLKEYLPELLPRKKWNSPIEPYRVGDVVMIVDILATRNNWVKGTIIKTFKGSKGQVRVVEVRTSKGIYTRPVHRLIKLLSTNKI